MNITYHTTRDERIRKLDGANSLQYMIDHPPPDGDDIVLVSVEMEPTEELDAVRKLIALDFCTALLKTMEPQEHWSTDSRSLVMRLRGIYAIGPNANQMGPDDKPEFGWRTFADRPPIQIEAAARIEALQSEIDDLKFIIERSEATTSIYP